jgi:hypothetical protein
VIGFCLRSLKLAGTSWILMLAGLTADFDSTKLQATGETGLSVFAMIAVSFLTFY